MAVITSSSFVLSSPQADGRVYVTETHIWDGGVAPTVRHYGPVSDALDHQAIANAEAPRIMELRAEEEATRVFAVNASFTLVYQTGSQCAERFWTRLRIIHPLDRVEFSRMVWWLRARVQAGDITNDAARTTHNAAYGKSLSVAQWNSFVTNTLTPIADRYQAVLDQVDL